VAQHLADAFEITTTDQYLSSESVSEAVGIDSGEFGRLRTCSRDATDRGASHRRQWCQTPDEHMTFTLPGVPVS